ncbi:MAG: 2-C-methyl-D-erythritol 2,4-cyclodiphosphate synthase [Ignavibacteriales bacterium]|nr:2-C-methyl-D-erythritol 2,4-cyclodiphosphate synthase [Ignavibacteriales bacterium]
MKMIQPFRIGYGYDVHAFAENRSLILGGVEIPYTKGLAGHSDADVLVHAICDALLGTLSLGDIGHYFPDTDMKYKNADSKNLLSEVYSLIKKEGYVLGNLDSVLALQNPKIGPFVNKMKETIAELLESEPGQISIKATTTERLGFVGREEGVEASAVVLIVRESV